MSHKHEDIICPNCGYHATENYCAKCGQETHLHEDSFWSLIMHFIGHYFHYDSKFWQTLKALWFSPGKLTIAYLNKQRMRYIAPVSLYIFISAVFFLVSSLLPDNNKIVKVNSSTTTGSDSVSIANKASATQLSKNTHGKTIYSFSNSFDKQDTKDKTGDKTQEEFKERFLHNIPKVFFFMIPLMAFILQLLFHKRKEQFYVNHIIYALHYHSFWFSILLLYTLYPFKKGNDALGIIVLILSAYYFITSLRNVYHTSWLRSVLYSIITAIIYAIFAIAAMIAVFFILLHTMKH